MKKIIAVLLAASVATAAVTSFAACKEKEQEQSALRGTFRNSGETDVVFTDNKNLVGTQINIPIDVNGVQIDRYFLGFSATDVYPVYKAAGSTCVYSYSQTLKLKRDFSYEYTYSLQLRIIDLNVNLGKIDVTLGGDFSYEDDGSNEYKVTLSNPVSGSENFYGAFMAEPQNIASWQQSSVAGYSLNLADVYGKEDYSYDKFTAGRVVAAIKSDGAGGSVNRVKDDVTFPDMLNYTAKYYTYEGSNGSIVNPDVPDNPDNPDLPVNPNPDKPEETGRYARLPYNDNGAAVDVTESLAIKIKTADTVNSVTVDGNEITEYKISGGERVFTCPVSFEDIKKTFTIKAEREYNFLPETYLRDFLSYDKAGLDDLTVLEKESEKTLAASILNYSKSLGADVSFDSAAESLIYASLGSNIYHADWGKRDNADGDGDWNTSLNTGFEWSEGNGRPTLNSDGNGAYLSYTFTANAGAITAPRAKITCGDGEYFVDATVSSDNSDAAKTKYAFKTENIAVLDYSAPVSVKVYDGETPVSNNVTYSVTRAIAYADYHGDAEISKALYSLAKAALWNAYAGENFYDYKPAIGGNGIYDLSLGEFVYSDGRMIASQDTKSNVPFGVSDSLYTTNFIYGGAFGSVAKDGDVPKGVISYDYDDAQKLFTIELNGADLDGIYLTVSNSAAPCSLKIIVTGDSRISGRLIDSWNYAPASAASVTGCENLEIECRGGATLTVRGALVAKGDAVINGNVKVLSTTAANAVSAENISVSGGLLNVEYCGYGVNTVNAAVAADTVSVSGANLSVEGYGYGVKLSGENNYFLVTGESAVEINSHIAVEGKTMNFHGGEIKLYGTNQSGVIKVENAAEISIENCAVTIENLQFAKTGIGRAINSEVQTGVKVTVDGTAKLFIKNVDYIFTAWGCSDEAKATLTNNGMFILDGYRWDTWEYGGHSLKVNIVDNGIFRATNKV